MVEAYLLNIDDDGVLVCRLRTRLEDDLRDALCAGFLRHGLWMVWLWMKMQNTVLGGLTREMVERWSADVCAGARYIASPL